MAARRSLAVLVADSPAAVACRILAGVVCQNPVAVESQRQAAAGSLVAEACQKQAARAAARTLVVVESPRLAADTAALRRNPLAGMKSARQSRAVARAERLRAAPVAWELIPGQRASPERLAIRRRCHRLEGRIGRNLIA